MRIAFAGTPAFAVPPLAALLDSPHEVVGVLTQPDRPAGRGRQLSQSAVKEFACSRQLSVDQPSTLRSAAGRQALERWRPELLVVVAYGLLLPPEVLSLPRYGCLNIHGSLLPRWRGAAPIQRALLAGDSETGVTIMQMDVGLDTGPVWLEKRMPIEREDDSASLHQRLAVLGASALLETLDLIAAGDRQPRAQASEGVTYAKKISKEEARIDWRESASLIERRIRAYRPWPMAYTSLPDGEILRLHEARTQPAESTAQAEPGTVLGLQGDLLIIACGEGLLGVSRVQRAGRRVVTAREFANAARSIDGKWGS